MGDIYTPKERELVAKEKVSTFNLLTFSLNNFGVGGSGKRGHVRKSKGKGCSKAGIRPENEWD